MYVYILYVALLGMDNFEALLAGAHVMVGDDRLFHAYVTSYCCKLF